MSQPDPNVERFEGYADLYDDHRPQPPAVLVNLLTQLAEVERPALVVDLGSGSGPSTRLWAERADQVVGIEPGEDMRRVAAARTSAPNVHYQAGYGHATGLPDGGADIVTASQALHWMDPEPTFAEVARILRPGGIFAAVDCDWPPAMHWKRKRPTTPAWCAVRRSTANVASPRASAPGPRANTWAGCGPVGASATCGR